MIQDLLATGLRTIGIEGVSTVALVLLVSLALYAHKASTAGRKVVYVGSTVTRDLKLVALVLVALLLIGLVNADMERGRELYHMARQWLAPYLRQLGGFLP